MSIRRKSFILLLAVTLTLTMMPRLAATAFAEAGTDAAGGDAIQLVENGALPTIKGGQGGTDKGGVYFGNYLQNADKNGKFTAKDPIKWRVLRNADGKLFLLADKILDAQKWHENGEETITWSACSLRTWLNGAGFLGEAFSPQEGKAILQTTVKGSKLEEYEEQDSYEVRDVYDNTASSDKVFLLSFNEVLDSGFGFDSDYYHESDTRGAKCTAYAKAQGAYAVDWDEEYLDGGVYWLRTYWAEAMEIGGAVVFLYDGSADLCPYDYTDDSKPCIGVRPVFNLDLSAVLFASDAVNGKATAVGLAPVASNTSGEWKFTLKDEGHSKFTVDPVEITNDKVKKVTYSGAATGENEFISAIIKNKAGKVTYYGKLKKCAAGGDATGTVDVDTTNVGPEDTLYIFNEQCNGDKKTDYASSLKELQESEEKELQESEEKEVVPENTLMVRLTAKGKKALTISWAKKKGAAGYEIFFARCNHGGVTTTSKKVKTIKGNKTFKWTKSGLKKGVAYKAYVKAYVMKDGKKSYVAVSPLTHAFTANGPKGYTNPKSVKVKKAKVTLKKGKTFAIKAKVKKIKKGGKLLSANHAPKLRYMTSNSDVATVSRKGKITAKAKGTCKVYAYAVNGVSKAVKVTVK